MYLRFKKGEANLDVLINIPEYLPPEVSTRVPIEIINRGCDLSHVKVTISPCNDKLRVDFHEYVRWLPKGEVAEFTADIKALKLGTGELVVNISAIDENYNELTFAKKLKAHVHIIPSQHRKLWRMLAIVLIFLILISLMMILVSPI